MLNLRFQCFIGVVCGLPWVFAAAESYASDHFIQVSGVCSDGFVGGKGDGSLANFSEVTAIDADVNQDNSMAEATADLRTVLDTYCLDDDWCYIYTYSNGGAVASRTLSIYDTPWNIYWVMSSGSNEGGSELSRTGIAAQIFLGCGLAGNITPSDHRSGWNHNDTHGNTFYMVAGNDGWWYSSFLLPGEDDGAVAFHSAGGLRDTFSVDTLCLESSDFYDNHKAAYACEGFPDNHFETKMRGICELGGC